MTKLGTITIITFISIVILQQCKTHKEAISEIATQKKTNQSIKEDSVPVDIFSMQPDSTIYIFSEEDIEKIKKQIPNELLPYPPLPGQDYDEQTLLLLMTTTMETKKAFEYLPVFTENSTKTTFYQLEQKKKKELKEQLKNGGVYNEGDGLPYSFQTLDSTKIPDIIKKVFPKVSFYYTIIFTQPTSKHLFWVYDYTRYSFRTDFNKVYSKMGHDTEINIKDKIKSLILLNEGINRKVGIIEIMNISKKIENWQFIFNYQILAQIDKKIIKYYLYAEDNQPIMLLKYIDNKYKDCIEITKV